MSKESKDKLLLIFTKNPVAGKVKTRLAKDLGNEKALEIYKFLLFHSVKFTSPIKSEKHVYYSDTVNPNDIWDNDIYIKKKQSGKDLGERMYNAFNDGFEKDYKRIIIIGSDMYDIDSEVVEKAFRELKDHDYVIGPAEDGGYYLFGMKALNSNVFKNKNWGSSSVLEDTLKDLEDKNVKLLEILNDVDVLEDIKDHPAFQKYIN